MDDRPAESFTLHALQWRVEPGRIEPNLRQADQLIDSAAPREGDVVVMPEMFSTGFFYPALEEAARRAPEILSWMASRAERARIHLAGSFAVQTEAGIANRMAVLGPRGEEGVYDKVHLFPPTAEDRYFAAGTKMAGAELGASTAGLLICFDLRFPEAARVHALGGAGLLLVSAQWPLSRADHFRLLVRARAMENQVFVAAANACGQDGSGIRMAGGSLIVGPDGEVLAEMGTEEGAASALFSRPAVLAARRDFPTLSRRRPEAYKLNKRLSGRKDED